MLTLSLGELGNKLIMYISCMTFGTMYKIRDKKHIHKVGMGNTYEGLQKRA
jgi:hypothetical protein